MFGRTKDGFSKKRIEEAARVGDVIDRAGRNTNAAIDQARDRLGTPGMTGKTIV